MKKTTVRLGSTILLGGIGLLALAACGVPDDSSEESDEASTPAAEADESISQSSEELRIGGPIGPIGPRPCGNNVCGTGTFCCNASCGTCAPLGGACTQQVCLPTE